MNLFGNNDADRRRQPNENSGWRIAKGAALVILACGIAASISAEFRRGNPLAFLSPSSSLSSSSLSSSIESTITAEDADSPRLRMAVPDGADVNSQNRRREAETASPAIDEAKSFLDSAFATINGAGNNRRCEGLIKNQCKKDRQCTFTDEGCAPKANANGWNGGDVGKEKCATISSKKKCKKDPACRYNRKKGYCHSRRRKKATTTKTTTAEATATEATTTVATTTEATTTEATKTEVTTMAATTSEASTMVATTSEETTTEATTSATITTATTSDDAQLNGGGVLPSDRNDPTPDKCPTGQCPSPKGECGLPTQCFTDPCVANPCNTTQVCTANYCGGCHRTCSPAPAGPDDGGDPRPEKYWPMVSNGVHECVYSSKYPEEFLYMRMLVLFDRYEDCCDVYRCDVDETPSVGQEVATAPTGATVGGPRPPVHAKCAVGPAAERLGVDPCADSHFCQLGAGACMSPELKRNITTHFGRCTARPALCMEMYAPVCGCDGTTYANECKAAGAGRSVLHRGKCGKDPLLGGNGDSGHFLTEPTGGSVGVITRRPTEPAAIDPPPGSTKCAVGPAGDGDPACAKDEYCEVLPGTCDAASPETTTHHGKCAKKPEACPMISSPVCGCDGQSYDNPCMAGRAGTSVSHRGPCLLLRSAVPEPVGPIPYLATVPAPTEPAVQDGPGRGDPEFKLRQGSCAEDAHCEGGLVCHESSGECVCDASSNVGCDTGQICGVPPGMHCFLPDGCPPACTCDYTSDATDGSNGCPVGEVCREGCAIADGGPRCFKSNEKRDCDFMGSNYMCRDSNGDGVIDKKDYAAGCVEIPPDEP